MKQALAILPSAILFSLAFIDDRHFWWTIFIFLIPLFFYAKSAGKLSLITIFFWSVIINAALLFSPLESFVRMGNFHPLLYLCALIFLLYFSTYAPAWIYLTQRADQWLQSMPILSYVWWIATTCCYFFFMQRYSLWIFARAEGFFFYNPLLPLANHPFFLVPLGLIGSFGMLILIISSQMIPVMFWRKEKKYALFLTGIIALIWIISYEQFGLRKMNDNLTSSQLNHIGIMVCQFPLFYEETMAISLQYQLVHQLEKNPALTTLILPESAFYAKAISPAIASYWHEHRVGKKINLIIGSFYTDQDNRLFNACYQIQNGAIINRFDKKHTMLFTENLPSVIKNDLFTKLLFNQLPERTAGSGKRELFDLGNGIQAVPYLCSELFFSQAIDDCHPTTPIIALCNDWWLSYSYARRLMLLAAQVRAIEWQRPIIYCSFFYSYLITNDAELHPINYLV